MEIKHSNFVKVDSVSSNNYIGISDVQDVLPDILYFVPYEDLLNNCRLVCKQWNDIIKENSIWKLKCEREKINVPSCELGKVPDNYYQHMYVLFKNLKKKFVSRNFIENSCGQEGLDKWEIINQGGDGFKVENPPEGADPVPERIGFQSCFATSYGDCRKYQIIDLYKNKTDQFLLINDLVNFKFGDWYVPRYDCTAEYELNVKALDTAKNIIGNFVFKTDDRGPALGDQKWFLMTHKFDFDVTKIRYIHFEHAGKDNLYWAGHYGMKFTGSFVKFYLKGEEYIDEMLMHFYETFSQ